MLVYIVFELIFYTIWFPVHSWEVGLHENSYIAWAFGLGLDCDWSFLVIEGFFINFSLPCFISKLDLNTLFLVLIFTKDCLQVLAKDCLRIGKLDLKWFLLSKIRLKKKGSDKSSLDLWKFILSVVSFLGSHEW